MKSEEKVLNFLENNYGYITTKDILNLKIASIKVKFAPMFTVNRMGSKTEENADAKK